ncbi:hypothetical protein ACLESO_35550, partial [Pyxidicoccus sp. 3LG]
ELFREREADAYASPADVFWKQAELQILQGMALAIVGRTADLTALLERVQAEQPEVSPFRAGTLLSPAVLCAYTGRFAGVLETQFEQLERLRGLREVMGRLPRRLAWALGMGGYMMNMNLALRGEPLDGQATRDGYAVAEAHGFTDVRAFHLFSVVTRAAFTGDGAAFVPAFTEKTDLVRRLGNPRLMERNLAIFTPPYYLERGEHEHVAAVVARAETLAQVLPGDRWLQAHVQVYQACRDVLFEDAAAARQSLPKALAAAREGGLRMETLLRVYQSRFEREQGNLLSAAEAAEDALTRALDPMLANPWDEIIARRAVAGAAARGRGRHPPAARAGVGGADGQRAADGAGAAGARGARARDGGRRGGAGGGRGALHRGPRHQPDGADQLRARGAPAPRGCPADRLNVSSGTVRC